jgi:hypothetical protein
VAGEGACAPQTSERGRLSGLFRKSANVLSRARGKGVAQISNLLYRRIPFCRARADLPWRHLSRALPIRNRRYGRLEICATQLPSIREWICEMEHLGKDEGCAAAHKAADANRGVRGGRFESLWSNGEPTSHPRLSNASPIIRAASL